MQKDHRQVPNLIVGERYKVLQVIGSGSFGEVFEGIDVISNIRVAIKLVSNLALLTSARFRRKLVTSHLVCSMKLEY